MTTWPLTVLIGNPKPHSRTRAVAVDVAEALWQRLVITGTPLVRPRVADLSELTAELVGQGSRPELLEEVFEAVRRPGLLLVASPTFKAAYSGLLKMFVDLLPRSALTNVVAVPLMTCNRSDHRSVVDSHLRPLLVEAGARVPAPGLCVLEREFDAPERCIQAWVGAAAGPVAAALRERVPA
jgi:FMN reductase